MRILVAGALGEVGRTVSAALVDVGHEVVRVSGRAPLTDEPDVIGFDGAQMLVREHRVDAVINCAGRGDRRASERTGRDATDKLALAVREAELPAVLISTTRVLEGYDADYAEDAPPKPLTSYAEANAENEAAWLSAAGPTAHVLRITNYIAQPSSVDSPQASLLPWSLVTEALATGHIGVRSGASLAKEFVGAADVASAAVLILTAPDAPQIVATVPGAVLTMANLVSACQRAFVAAGKPEPTASFGADAPAGPACRPGWLESKGWVCELGEATVEVEIKFVIPTG